jgi:RHS repeat-associated protein
MHTANSPYWVTTPANIKTHNVYDGNFRKTSATAAYGTSQALTTFLGYDNVGNVTDVTEPLAVTHNTFDTRNRKLTATEAYRTNLAQTTTWHYDEASNIYQIDRPDGTYETKSYDALNRVLTDTVPKSTNPVVNIVTTFNYNPSGTLNWVRDGENHTYNFSYDASDQRITMTYPNNGGTQTWAYDNVHNPKWRITVNTVNFEAKYFYYDSRNRLYATWWYNWDDSIRTPDWRYFGYDAASRLTEAENGTGGWGSNVISDVHRFYDDANHLTQEQQNVTVLGLKTVNYPTYDNDGRLTSMNVTGVQDYNYTFSYDAMGRFEKIFTTNGPQLFQYYYDAASNERERDNVSSGVQQIYPRDALNRMQYMDVKKGASTLGYESYGYNGPDGAMNRLTSVDYGNGHTDSFSYYLDGELKQAQLGNFNRNVTYNLDRAGNRTSVADTGVTTNYNPNAINQYTAVTGHSIGNGPEHEISGFDSVNYTYINDERLKTVTSGSNTYNLVYDALGRCVKRTLAGVDTYYIYDGEKPILEYDVSGNRVGFNLYGKGIDEILKRGAYGTDNQWHWYFFQQNHEGSVTHLTDAAGNVIEQYRYDAFGAPTIYAPNWTVRTSTIYDNRFLFTGREYAATYRSIYNVPAFNFYEYRARAYNATLGRFMSEDPKLFDAGDYNLFRYCHNDPLDFTDPMGTYAMGSGWNAWQWQQFNQAQQGAAQRIQNASDKIDKALADKAAADKTGKESKTFSSMSKAFEKTFGKGSDTAENMAKVSQTYKQMVTALRDNGLKRYIANAMTAKEVAAKGWDANLFGRGVIGGKKIQINVDHPLFNTPSALSWTAGHESSHNARVGDYAYRWQSMLYNSLTPKQRLDNADSYMDFATHQ